MDLPHNSNPWRKFMQDYFVGNGLSRQIAQFGRDFQFGFNHDAILRFELRVTTLPDRRLLQCCLEAAGSFADRARSSSVCLPAAKQPATEMSRDSCQDEWSDAAA